MRVHLRIESYPQNFIALDLVETAFPHRRASANISIREAKEIRRKLKQAIQEMEAGE